MEIPCTILVGSESETESLAKSFSNIIKEGDVIALNGELGSGKTFFIKSLCKSYGIKNVSSPSFAIVNEYDGIKKIYHFDFYRIKKITELYDLGFDDYLNDSDAIIFIEWAELWKEILPKHYYEIWIKFDNGSSRIIEISKK